jgi:hypothetical protein
LQYSNPNEAITDHCKKATNLKEILIYSKMLPLEKEIIITEEELQSGDYDELLGSLAEVKDLHVYGNLSLPASSITEILKIYGVKTPAVKFNKTLTEKGYLKDGNITKKGLPYGFNWIANSKTQEKQPRWFISRFETLLKKLGSDN